MNQSPTVAPRTAHYDTAWQLLEYWATADSRAVKSLPSVEEAHGFLATVRIPQTLVVTDAFAEGPVAAQPATHEARPRYVVVGVVEPEHIDVDDEGQAMMIQLSDEEEYGGDGCFFVKLQSWDESVASAPIPDAAQSAHRFFRSLIGKKVRVTVEVIED